MRHGIASPLLVLKHNPLMVSARSNNSTYKKVKNDTAQQLTTALSEAEEASKELLLQNGPSSWSSTICRHSKLHSVSSMMLSNIILSTLVCTKMEKDAAQQLATVLAVTEGACKELPQNNLFSWSTSKQPVLWSSANHRHSRWQI